MINIDCIIVRDALRYNFRLITPLIGQNIMETFIRLHRPCSCPTMNYPLCMFPDIVTTRPYDLAWMTPWTLNSCTLRMTICLKLSPSDDREHARRHYCYTVYGTLVKYLTWYILQDVPHTPLSSRANRYVLKNALTHSLSPSTSSAFLPSSRFSKFRPNRHHESWRHNNWHLSQCGIPV